MKNLALSMMVCLSAVVISCAPTPPRHSSVSQAGVRGRLVDATNGAPIAKHPVRVAVDGIAYDSATNPQGKWRIPAEKFRNGTSFSQANIRIDCNGYEHRQFQWKRDTSRKMEASEAGIVNLGTIRLKRY